MEVIVILVPQLNHLQGKLTTQSRNQLAPDMLQSLVVRRVFMASSYEQVAWQVR